MQHEEPTVAVIGLGRIGTAIAGRLTTAHTLRVWNRTSGRADGLLAAGATEHGTAAAAVTGAHVVCSALFDGPASIEVLIGGGVIDAMAPGSCLVEHSTSDLASSAQLADACERTGVSYVRAPVSGTAEVITAGNATLIVSGPPEAIEQVTPVLAAIAPNIEIVGDGDEARVAKLGVNLMLAGTMQLLAEAVVLAERNGLSRERFLGAIGRSVMASRYVGYKSAALVERDYTASFSVSDIRKDVDLALDAAGVDLPVTAMVAALLADASDLALGGADFAALLPRLQVRTGGEADLPSPAPRGPEAAL